MSESKLEKLLNNDKSQGTRDKLLIKLYENAFGEFGDIGAITEAITIPKEIYEKEVDEYAQKINEDKTLLDVLGKPLTTAQKNKLIEIVSNAAKTSTTYTEQNAHSIIDALLEDFRSANTSINSNSTTEDKHILDKLKRQYNKQDSEIRALKPFAIGIDTNTGNYQFIEYNAAIGDAADRFNPTYENGKISGYSKRFLGFIGGKMRRHLKTRKSSKKTHRKTYRK